MNVGYICIIITRTAEEEVKLLASQFKAITIVGPRQSGKTILARTVFPNKQYVSLENLDNRLFATRYERFFSTILSWSHF